MQRVFSGGQKVDDGNLEKEEEEKEEEEEEEEEAAEEGMENKLKWNQVKNLN